jgi:hypothetical protein
VVVLGVIAALLAFGGRGGGSGAAGNLDSPLLTGDEATRGTIVATVNGRPIYQQDYEERVEADKAMALADPLFGIFLNNFEGYTGTRALDILKQDALDRLINLEIVQQQAVKEGLFPDVVQQRGIIEEAKKRDLQSGQTFEQFLATRNLTEARYNRRVIRNLVYAVMANSHMPAEGNTDQRTEAYARWICETRNKVDPATQRPLYDVKINLTFTVENPPCTSGLPPDIPLPGIDQEAPEPISTPGGTDPQGPPAP